MTDATPLSAAELNFIRGMYAACAPGCTNRSHVEALSLLATIDAQAATIATLETALASKYGFVVDEHLRHMTDGHWHDNCGYCLTRRVKGGTGIPQLDAQAATIRDLTAGLEWVKAAIEQNGDPRTRDDLTKHRQEAVLALIARLRRADELADAVAEILVTWSWIGRNAGLDEALAAYREAS